MLNTKIRGVWDRLMRPVGRLVSKGRISPNAVTVTGVVVQGVVALYILQGKLLVAGLIAIVAGLLDAVDGAVAKASGRTTRFGALLDSTTDRLSDALFFLPVAWLYGVAPDIAERDEPWVAAIALVALVASFLVSYVKARAEGLGLECNVGIAERAERVILLIAALVFSSLLPAIMVLLAALSTITVAQRIAHVRSAAAGA
ncbi:MAG TPA: CDP-alcohol phosphatidyltransferase family protein [Actinomycetota bacterium]|nr:CDP-alcohol phosphatidyltransferase family protein [Actinomycetota bacterium]